MSLGKPDPEPPASRTACTPSSQLEFPCACHNRSPCHSCRSSSSPFSLPRILDGYRLTFLILEALKREKTNLGRQGRWEGGSTFRNWPWSTAWGAVRQSQRLYRWPFICSADPVTYCPPHPTLTSKANYFNVYYVIYPPSIHTYKGAKVDSLMRKVDRWGGPWCRWIKFWPKSKERCQKPFYGTSQQRGDFPQSSY